MERIIDQRVIDNIIDWIRKQVPDNCKVVIGISGGKDSSVSAGLLVKALGVERVIGIMMPNGVQSDIDDSVALCCYLSIQNHIIDIGTAYTVLSDEICRELIRMKSPAYSTNTPSRLRMTVLYGVAVLLGNCRVVNNSNLSESFIGYSTLFGDSAGDFAPLAKLTSSEVVKLGDLLGLPYDLVHKTPSDGMCGLSDEDNLGFTYSELDAYIIQGIKGPNIDKILELNSKTSFKRKILNVPTIDPFRYHLEEI